MALHQSLIKLVSRRVRDSIIKLLIIIRTRATLIQTYLDIHFITILDYLVYLKFDLDLLADV